MSITFQYRYSHSIIFDAVYVSYLYFQLYSHAVLYQDKSDDVLKSTNYETRQMPTHANSTATPDIPRSFASRFGVFLHTNWCKDTEASTSNEVVTEEAEEEEPQLNLWMTVILLTVTTVVSSSYALG